MTELIVRELVLGKYVQLKHNKYQIVSTDYRDIFFFLLSQRTLNVMSANSIGFRANTHVD